MSAGASLDRPFTRWRIVLDFRSHRPQARNYLARGEQRRLLGAVLLLGLVMLLIAQIGTPESWHALLRMTQAPPPPALNTLLPSDRAPSVGKKSAPVDPDKKTGKLLPGVDAADLEPINDDSKLRDVERPAQYKILSLLGELEPAAIAEASIGPVPYIQPFEQPESYRGQAATIEGTVDLVGRANAASNDRGISTQYEGWIEPKDRPKEAVAIVCLELPEGLMEGRRLKTPVRVDGVVFKRLAYQNMEREWSLAPMLLARSVRPLPAKAAAPAKAAPMNVGTVAIVTLVMLAVALVVGFGAWGMARRNDAKNIYARAIVKGEPNDFASLRHLEVSPDVREALSRLADEPQDRGETHT